MENKTKIIGAVVLAAGMSIRMKQPKMLMRWGKTTVINHVVNTLLAANIGHIVVVTGGFKEEISELLDGVPVEIAYNQNYSNGEMLQSLKVGLLKMPEEIQACLMVLGDQPQIQQDTIRDISGRYNEKNQKIIIPSYQYRRGHPWLIDKTLWEEIINMEAPENLRNFLSKHNNDIEYINLETSTILQDLDTPEDYEKFKPTNMEESGE